MDAKTIQQIIDFVFIHDTDLAPIPTEKEKRMKERLIFVLEKEALKGE